MSGNAVALTIVTFLHVVFGELAPRSAALSHPEKFARWLTPPWKRRGEFSPILAQCISRSLIISFGRTTIFRRPVPR